MKLPGAYSTHPGSPLAMCSAAPSSATLSDLRECPLLLLLCRRRRLHRGSIRIRAEDGHFDAAILCTRIARMPGIHEFRFAQPHELHAVDRQVLFADEVIHHALRAAPAQLV